MMKFLMFVVLLYMEGSFAQDSGRAVQVSLATVYSHNRIFRGALIWDAPIMAIGPNFTFYNIVSLGQGGLSIFKKIGNHQTISIGLTAFDDNEPNGPVLTLEEREEDFKNQRSSTFGTYLKYDFRFRQLIAISLSYQKDLKRHNGSYLNSRISTSIIPFITLGFGGSLGDKKSNQYAYGPEGISGTGHIETFAGLMLPILPWRGRLILNYKRTKISKGRNANADYVRGNKTNQNFSIIATWRL